METENVILIAFMVASISFTIAVTSIAKGFREAVSKLHPKLEELIHCPYCIGHYVTFIVLLLIWDVVDFTYFILVNFFMTAFTIMGMVAVLHYFILVAYKPVSKMMMERAREKSRQE